MKQSDTKCHSERSEESQTDCRAFARNDKRMRELLRGGYTEKEAGQECPAYRCLWNNSSIGEVF